MQGSTLAVQGQQEVIGDTCGKQKYLLRMLQHPDGLTIDRAMLATGWQPHSIRGVLSVLRKNHGLTIISDKNEAGECIYREIPVANLSGSGVPADIRPVIGRFSGFQEATKVPRCRDHRDGNSRNL